MRSSRLRLAVKALEHPFWNGSARRRRIRTFCTSSGSPRRGGRRLAPPAEEPRCLHRARHPPATNGVERRPLEKRSSRGSTESSSTHSERHNQLAEFGIARGEAARYPTPCLPRASPIERTTDGRCSRSASIRPYKGTEDAVEAVMQVDGARLLVVGDPRVRSKAPADRRRQSRVATRLSARRRARRALGGDGRALPLPRRDRPVRRPPAGARGRCAGDRLRRRWAGRNRRAFRSGRASYQRETWTRWRTAFASFSAMPTSWTRQTRCSSEPVRS